ncbi:MAG: transposase [Saprospiraceae bacterium]|nr:transposase [Saprospiraceae bacterium]MCB0575476.1 transposase [Saprospiraceae bacterium]
MFHRYYDLYFTTATILEWKHLLRTARMKMVVVDSLRYLVSEHRAVIYAFVVMPNHIHLIWQIPQTHSIGKVKASLFSFTAHQFRKILKEENPAELERYRVDLVDRAYQFWERNPLSVMILHDEVYYQKVAYVHRNPCAGKWKLAPAPELYRYSSAFLIGRQPFWDFVAGSQDLG